MIEQQDISLQSLQDFGLDQPRKRYAFQNYF